MSLEKIPLIIILVLSLVSGCIFVYTVAHCHEWYYEKRRRYLLTSYIFIMPLLLYYPLQLIFH